MKTEKIIPVISNDNLSPYIFSEQLEDIIGDNEVDLKKYHKEQWDDNEVYILNKEFLPKVKWDNNYENLICNFEIVADEEIKKKEELNNELSINNIDDKYPNEYDILRKALNDISIKQIKNYCKKIIELEEYNLELKDDKEFLCRLILLDLLSDDYLWYLLTDEYGYEGKSFKKVIKPIITSITEMIPLYSL